jgi:alkyl hydroperoxide reductase subunit F
MYDLAIIGGGPAGVAAGVYAARKQLKTVLIAEVIGGQSTESVGIENWIGTPKISGADLAKTLEAHVRAYAGEVVDIKLGERATKIEKGPTLAQGSPRSDLNEIGNFTITTSKGTYEAKAVLIASGGARRKLEVQGAAKFENKGVTYCASCDGPLFAGQDVVVVGGGNAGFESAAQLLAYCKSVTLVHRGTSFDKADPATVEAVLKHPNMKALTQSSPIEITGDTFVSGVVVKNVATGESKTVPATGVFVEIGMIPSTDYTKVLVELDPIGRVVVNPKNQHTSIEGVWAAGDCTDELYHQNNIAAGDAVKALEDIYYWLKAKK